MNTIVEKIQWGEVKTINDSIRYGMTLFEQNQLYFGHGTDNAADEARWLALHAIDLPVDSTDIDLTATLSSGQRRNIRNLFEKRVSSRKPAAYLTGEAWFYGLPFYVNDAVLIPRSPFAELIAEKFRPLLNSQPPLRILDLCTGSGCIGIACAIAFADSVVDLADISSEALKVAQKNVHRHGLGGRINIIQSDVFSALKETQYDLIVCNPPYVPQKSMDVLPDEYRHEPALGLAAGEDGLIIVRQIIQSAANYLTDNGSLFVEVGESEEAVQQQWPLLPLIWLDFAYGGEGVFYISANDLKRSRKT